MSILELQMSERRDVQRKEGRKRKLVKIRWNDAGG